MPHLTLEYSANLDDGEGIATLCDKLARCLDAVRDGDKRVYPVGGIRVRALRCEQYCVGVGGTDAAFLHANLKMARGRTEEVQRRTGDAILEVLKEHFAQAFEQRGLALSVEVNEFGPLGTWKHNNLHERLKSS